MVSIRQFFDSSHKLIQRSVAVCRDDFIASRLAALVEHFSPKVNCFAIEHEGFDNDARNDARAFVTRILDRRLHNRGRNRT